MLILVNVLVVCFVGGDGGTFVCVFGWAQLCGLLCIGLGGLMMLTFPFMIKIYVCVWLLYGF